jgi:hypothetical protein
MSGSINPTWSFSTPSRPAWTETFSSPIVIFIVGDEKKKIQAHSKVITSISKPMDKMFNSGMKESLHGEASLEVDVQLFELFLEFAYTGMYRTPGAAPVALTTTAPKVTGGGQSSAAQDEEDKSRWWFCRSCGSELAETICT